MLAPEPTPQLINGKRRHLTRRGARRSVHAEVARHESVLSLAADMQVTNTAVLQAARSQLGKPYCLAGCRCDTCPCRDCSGEICYALNTAGYPHVCTSSFGFAELGRRAGTIIPKDQALHTVAAIGIRCPFCDPNRNGSNGHVWFCSGNGVSSVEEGGHSTGCYEGHADKPGDVIYMLIPGVLYTPKFTTEATMFVQQAHYDTDGKVTRAVDDPGAIVFVSQDGRAIQTAFGASIFADQPIDPHDRSKGTLWTSPADPLPPGILFLSVAYRPADALDPHPGGVARCSDGSVRRFHLS